MSDKNAFGFGAFVPGFDFLQGLVQSAAKGAAGGVPQGVPDWSKWVAPTLQAEEIEKRVSELKTVQFWLEQNARALAATIQALEVQKMTLAALRGMNVQVNDLAGAFGFGQAAQVAPVERAPGSGAYDDMFTQRPSEEPKPEPAAQTSAPDAPAATPPPAVDPLQWWNALTGQFQQIAAGAMQEAAEKARQNPVGLQDAARQAFDAAGRMAAEVAAAATKVATAGTKKKSAAPRKAAPAKKVAATRAKAGPAAKAPARKAASAPVAAARRKR